MNRSIKAVVFDIDGTLSPDISWTKITHELGSSVPDHERIYENFKERKLTLEEGQEAMLLLWRGEGGVLRREKLVGILDKWILKNDVIEVFRFLKRMGILTCLITGSIDLFAEIIAKKVDADFWFANTELIWDKNNNLENLIFEPDAGKKKLNQFFEFCSQNNLRPQECLVVGDDSNDIQLFKTTGRGVAVESSTSYVLDDVAWKKISKLKEIKGLFLP